MLKNRSNTNAGTLFLTILLLMFAAACSAPAPKIETEPGSHGNNDNNSDNNGANNDAIVPPHHAPTHLPQYVKRAEANFLKGRDLGMAGNIESARHYFEQVMDILMESAPETSPVDYRHWLTHYITRISEIELDYLKDREANNGETRGSFLEEVMSTPLLKPSPHDIKRMKEKVNVSKPLYNIPVTVNSRVVSFIKAFSTTRKKNIQNALNRSIEYIDEFKRIFKSYDIPEDLAYLPIIESGYRVHARSRVRATGVWQFMAATARGFGLRVDWVVDERRDPYKSAHAAAKYLKQLHTTFKDWYLALACYNSGTRRINRAIKRLKTRDFFKIARSRYLRRETRNYVPAFLAGLIIAKNPATYGFAYQEIEKQFQHTKSIRIPSPVDLKKVSALTQTPYRQLQKINPELIRDFTPFNKKHYTIRVPETVETDVLEQLKRLPSSKRYFVGWYKVRRGDSLYTIARKFRTSVKKIKHANKLRSNLIHPGKRLLIPRGG
ncbi:MAG: transglycosylase SLT domain-containing protein [bacterium]|nr:transglycosylase SLT domain-containing protein [bacterium]